MYLWYFSRPSYLLSISISQSANKSYINFISNISWVWRDMILYFRIIHSYSLRLLFLFSHYFCLTRFEMNIGITSFFTNDVIFLMTKIRRLSYIFRWSDWWYWLLIRNLVIWQEDIFSSNIFCNAVGVGIASCFLCITKF